MERSIQKTALVDLVTLIAVATAAYAVAHRVQSAAGLLTAVYLGVATLVVFCSWVYLRLLQREAQERLEQDELTRVRTSGTLFEGAQAELLPAHRARCQFERYFVPGLTVLMMVLEGLAAWYFYRRLGKAIPGLREPVVAMSMYGLFALVLFLLGRFSLTLARIQNSHVLRPVGTYTLVGAYLNFATAAGIAAVQAGYGTADLVVGRAIAVLLGLIALETLVTLVLEVYRPRVRGGPARLLYDGRLLGLLAQPENLFTAAAHALDYQFGFKVSETWVFRLFRRYFPVLLAGQLALLELSTCVVVIEPGEQGILERFGRLVRSRPVLNPGLHLKLPWPVDQVHRFNTDQIQRFDIGYTPDPQSEKTRVIVWGTKHANEDPFLVADREAVSRVQPQARTADTRRAPPVSLLTVNIPVYYQVTNVLAWYYNNNAPSNLLQALATREVAATMVSVDLGRVMSVERLELASSLQDRIQAAADRHGLGVRVVFVGLQGVHPPVEVAPDYEKVVAAAQKRLAKIQEAMAFAIQTNALADAHAFTTTNRALAESTRLKVTWGAMAALFTNRIPAFEAAPVVYTQRLYFKTVASALAQPRKYLLLTTNNLDVIVFDLQDRIREDLLNITVPGPGR